MKKGSRQPSLTSRQPRSETQTVEARMPIGIPCATLSRAQKFYDNGMAFLEMGEEYSALMNLALAANTLTELRNLAKFAQLPDDCPLNPELCETQRESLCNLDIAIDKILRKVHVLKKRVIEIRSQYSSGAPGAGEDGDCKQTKNVEIKYVKARNRKNSIGESDSVGTATTIQREFEGSHVHTERIRLERQIFWRDRTENR